MREQGRRLAGLERERLLTVSMPLDDLPVGTVVTRSEWPLHVTLLPNVRVRGFDATVDAALGLAAELGPVRAAVGAAALFGPGGDVPVRLVHAHELIVAHDRLHAALADRVPVRPVTPAHHGPGHRPHLTLRSGDLPPELVLRSLVVAELEPDGLPPGSAAIVAAAGLGSPRPGGAADEVRVLAILDLLTGAGLRCWVIGGWGVDALVGHQRRPHHDLDLFVDAETTQRLTAALRAAGAVPRLLWSESRWVDGLPTALVAVAADGMEVDLHVVRLEAGRPVPLSDSSVELPAAALDGVGRIGGRTVPCATAAAQLVMHTGYPLPDRQRSDVELLRRLAHCAAADPAAF